MSEVAVQVFAEDGATGEDQLASLVSEGKDVDGQGRRVQTEFASGARSTAVLRPEGTVHLNIQPPVDVGGRRNEDRVCNTLVAAMRASGVPVESRRSGDDARGEDGVLIMANEEVPVQIVTVPYARDFWHQVHAGSGTTQVPWADAAGWIHEALASKSVGLSAAGKGGMLVALDATHAGVLDRPEVVDNYLSRFPAPQAEFGFGACWVVGPSDSCTTRLGEGRW